MSLPQTNLQKPSKILIIEDEPEIAEITGIAFEELDISYHACTNHQEVTNITPEIPHFDALILDLLIPGMDSIEFIFNLRNQYANKPFIFIHSAFGLSTFPWNQLGVSGFFEKPHSAIDLRNKVIDSYKECIFRHSHKRSDFRIPHPFVAHIKSAALPNTSIEARGINLSKNGICLEVDSQIPKNLSNHEVAILFKFPLLENSSNCFQIARIVWTKNQGNKCLIGLEFTGFPSNELNYVFERIQSFLKAEMWKIALH